MAAPAHTPNHPDTLLHEAACWYACLKADNASAADHAQWSQWLAASAAHRQAWARIQKVVRQLDALPPHIATHVFTHLHMPAHDARHRSPS